MYIQIPNSQTGVYKYHLHQHAPTDTHNFQFTFYLRKSQQYNFKYYEKFTHLNITKRPPKSQSPISYEQSSFTLVHQLSEQFCWTVTFNPKLG